MNYMPAHEPFENLLKPVSDVFIQGVKCLAGTRGIVYTTVPITSGYNQFKLMHELNCSAEELKTNSDLLHRYRADVLDANLLSAASWADQARNAFPGKVVLDPSQLFVLEWKDRIDNQKLYYELWDRVIAEFAHTVIATPKWAFSLGSRKEIEIAIRAGLQVTDIIGDEFKVDELIAQDADARRELRDWGWSPSRISEALPPLVVDLDSEPRPPASVENRHWHEIFNWVHEDIVRFGKERELYTPFTDDLKTQKGWTSPDSWKVAKFEKYWSNSLRAGLAEGNGLGRLELASMCVCAVAALQSSVRLYGRLPTHEELRANASTWKTMKLPKVPTFNYNSTHEVNRVATDVFTWLQKEHKKMRERHPIERDNRDTESLARDGHDSPWGHELWNEHLMYAQQKGLETIEGRYHLGLFTASALRLLESAVSLYGSIPARKVQDVTRKVLREENSGIHPKVV
jgi:hypothetical protein